MTGPAMPDPKERKFFLVRTDYNTAGQICRQTPIDPVTGNAIDPQKDPSTLMTLDEADAMGKACVLHHPSPLVEFKVMAVITAPPAQDPYTGHVDRTDAGNANLLIRLANGNLRYVHETKQWLRWTGSRWQIDEYETFVTGHALEVAKFYFQEAQAIRKGEYRFTSNGRVEDGEELYKWGIKCRSKAAIEAMITLARKADGVPISVNELDRDPWLLGVDNGVVDLRTGQLRERESREDYVTKRCRVRYNPNAQAPRWERFIAEITGQPIPVERDANGIIPETVGRFTPRPILARYLQKALGYSITGSTSEQKLFMAIGAGSNGKNVVFEAVKRIINSYATVIPAAALMVSERGLDAERPTSMVASLAGARFALASETTKTHRIDTGMIKNHTGDREMTARRLYANPFTFTITHKLWLMTNLRPALDNIDEAIRGRLHLVLFERKWNRPGEPNPNPALPDGDKELVERLKAEDEGILAWLVRGAVLYQREGLEPPGEVTAVTLEYFHEEDVFGRWLATLKPCAPRQGTLAKDLLSQFWSWLRTEGFPTDIWNQKNFGSELKRRSIESERCADGIRYGLMGLPIPPPPGGAPIVPTPPPPVPPPPPQ